MGHIMNQGPMFSCSRDNYDIRSGANPCNGGSEYGLSSRSRPQGIFEMANFSGLLFGPSLAAQLSQYVHWS